METNPGWLKLLLAATNFHDPKPVRAIEVLLYYLYVHYNISGNSVNGMYQ